MATLTVLSTTLVTMYTAFRKWD